MDMSDLHPGQAVDQRLAAAYLGLGVDQLRYWRRVGVGGPQYFRVSDSPRSAVRYRVRDLDAWMESRLERGAA